MTAPNGSIVFNNSTGSDTQASGLGPANAVYGTGASTTGASAVVTGIDTTGVTAGDLLWVESSSGRQFSIIASVDSSTQVTCDGNFDNTESGRTWAIGGKRATLQGTLSLFSDELGVSHVVELETDQTLTSTISWAENTNYAGITIRSDVAGTKRTITQTSDSTDLFNTDGMWNSETDVVFQDIKFLNTASVKDECIRQIATNGHPQIIFIRCQVGDTGSSFTSGFYAGAYCIVHAFDTVFKACLNHAIRADVNAYFGSHLQGCMFIDCPVGLNTSFQLKAVVNNCIFSGCSTDAINIWENSPTKNWTPHVIKNCIFYNNGNAIKLNSYTGTETKIIGENIFVNNTTAINSAVTAKIEQFYRNAFYGNGTDISANISIDQNHQQINLTADPFVNAANGDFNINTSNGGGAALRSTSYDLGG